MDVTWSRRFGDDLQEEADAAGQYYDRMPFEQEEGVRQSKPFDSLRGLELFLLEVAPLVRGRHFRTA